VAEAACASEVVAAIMAMVASMTAVVIAVMAATVYVVAATSAITAATVSVVAATSAVTAATVSVVAATSAVTAVTTANARHLSKPASVALSRQLPRHGVAARAWRCRAAIESTFSGRSPNSGGAQINLARIAQSKSTCTADRETGKQGLARRMK
jgi:hypothetical protein